jgi:hypothetical protein
VKSCWIKAFILLFGLAFAAQLPLGWPSGVAKADVLDTLRQDDGGIHYVFSYPDVYGDDYRNERFQSPESGTLTGVLIAFATHDFQSLTTGDPALVVMVWPSGADSFPVLGQELLKDTIPFADYSTSVFSLDSGVAGWHNRPSQFVTVDLSGYGVPIEIGEWFHVGYSAVLNSADDSLVILSDDGVPASNRSSEYYHGQFELMSVGWAGVNFMIRPILSVPSGTEILEPDGTVRDFTLKDAYPNPFNPSATIRFDLARPEVVRLKVFDMLGREQGTLVDGMLGAGSHAVTLNGETWSSGVYFVRLQSAARTQTIKIVLEK